MRQIIAISLLLLASMFSIDAHAQSGISEKLNQSLDAMVNYTPPGRSETNRRTVITGGSLALKLQTSQVQAFSFRPPSVSVGCGGIDAFFGAFSMVSKEVLVQALRAVVTGALQYAFRIALKVLCQSCEQIMSDIGKLLREANQWLGDMCNVTNNFLESKFGSSDVVASKVRASMGLTSSGQSDDAADSEKRGSPIGALADWMASNRPRAKNSMPELGNHIYDALKQSENQVFTFMGAKEDFFQEMISLIGAVVVCSVETHPGCPAPPTGTDHQQARQDGDPHEKEYGPLLSFEFLVKGSSDKTVNDAGQPINVSMWKCNETSSDDPCLALEEGQLTGFVSISDRIRNAFLGSGASEGIIKKMRYNYNASMTPEEELWMQAGGGYVGMIIDLATKDQHAAEAWVTEYADVIAADFTYEAIQQFLIKTRISVALRKNKSTRQLEMLDKAFDNVREDYMKIQDGAKGRSVAFEAYMSRAAALGVRS